MRGKDNVAEEELYEGTAKSMEGTLADECYGQAKNEGCKVKVVWQDHPTGKVHKCGGHVGRVHTNNLKEAAKKKEFSEDVETRHKEKFSEVETAKCKCIQHGLVVAAFQILSSEVLGSTTFVACSSVKIQLNMHSVLESCQSTTCVISILERKMVHVTFTLRKNAVARNVLRMKSVPWGAIPDQKSSKM